jgi:fluoroacetyl-CoA thioesterase
MLRPGLRATLEETVAEELTASRIGSGDVPVYATPAVVALIERAAVAALAGRLEPGSTSVGTRIELDHLAPTPSGARVVVTVRLEGVEGRRLRFAVEVADPAGPVARGVHLRHVVDRERFLTDARARA